MITHGAYHINLINPNINLIIAMAKTKQIVDGTESSRPAKKTTKAKLAFTAGTPVASKSTVINDLSTDEVTVMDAPIEAPIETVPTSAKKPAKKVTKSFEDLATLDIELAEVPVEEAPVAKKEPVSDLAYDGLLDQEIIDLVKGPTKLPVEELPSKVSPTPIPAPKPFVPAKKANHNGSKGSGYKASNKELPPAAGEYPEHQVNVALIIKNNAEIRRFTALGILNYLLQKGDIRGNSRFVSFKWNKFTVKCDNLTKDYAYSEVFFLNCLAAAFASFSASAQRTIDTFVRKEMNQGLGDVTSQAEIDAIHEAQESRN
jgi:hypothetical protein